MSKPRINYSKRLGMWRTADKLNPGKMILWEVDIEGEIDLLLYDNNTPRIEIEYDIETYYGKPFNKIVRSLSPLTPKYVYKKYINH